MAWVSRIRMARVYNQARSPFYLPAAPGRLRAPAPSSKAAWWASGSPLCICPTASPPHAPTPTSTLQHAVMLDHTQPLADRLAITHTIPPTGPAMLASCAAILSTHAAVFVQRPSRRALPVCPHAPLPTGDHTALCQCTMHACPVLPPPFPLQRFLASPAPQA